MQYKVEIPADIIRKARVPLERMLKAGK